VTRAAGATAARRPGPARRAQLLQVTARLFAERGFHGVSIEDIGAAAGISGPGVYRHFPSKDALLAEMLVDVSERLRDRGREQVGSAADARDALERLARGHIRFALEEPDLIRVQDRDLANLTPPQARAVRRLQRAYVETWVQALQAWDPSISAGEARARTHAVFGLLNSTPHSAVGQDDDVMRALLLDLAMACLCRPPVAS
jgi:AcrR family transcriptional regulator